MKKRNIFILILSSIVILTMAGNLYAGSISSAGVWLNRYQDESLNQHYAFYTDIYGTVSEFQSGTLTSPLNNTYPLSLAPEGDQWGSGVEGTEAEITSEFIDGIYTFDITFKDTTTDSIEVQQGGVLPPFPTSLSLTDNTITWDSWVNPISPYQIEFVIMEIDGDAYISAKLAYSETSYTVPADFLKNNTQYNIEVWFVSSQFANGRKASVSSLTTIIQDPKASPKPNLSWLMLLLDDAKEKCSELSETWHIELSDGSGSGEHVLKKDSNCEVTSSGSTVSKHPLGFDITYSYQSESVTITSEGEFDSISTGIASSPYGNSNFKVTRSGVVAKGYGTGKAEIEFFSPGWPTKSTVPFIMTRIDGSGITPETGSVDFNEGSDNQYLYCMSTCSRMDWGITNVSNVPTTITNTQSCDYEYNEFGINTVTTCTGEILVESTEITYNSSTIYNWESCTIEVVVDGIGSCQTN